MRLDSLPRLWRYINLLLTYLHPITVRLHALERVQIRYEYKYKMREVRVCASLKDNWWYAVRTYSILHNFAWRAWNNKSKNW